MEGRRSKMMSDKLVDISDFDPVNLLTQNEVYLNAVQKASISVYSLGFKPLDPNTIHRKDGLLTAVVPRLDQAPFLDRVDASVHSYIRQKRKQDQTSRMRCSMDPNSDVMKHLSNFQARNGAVNSPHDDGKSTKAKGKNKMKVVKINPNEEIRAARPTSRMEKEREERQKLEEELKKQEEHRQRIAKRFVIMKDGEEMVYDDNGNKVPLHVFEKQRAEKKKELEQKKKREEDEVAKVRRDALAKALTSQRELWVKSSTHVERLRQQAITQQKEYPFWQPGTLPASTITMATEKAALPPLIVFQKFPKTGEYDAAVHSMVPGDILITIEHCDHCHHHDEFTHHQSHQYEEMAKLVTQALKETAQRYALRFFSINRGIDEVDALKLSKSHAQSTIKQVEAMRSPGTTHHASNFLSLGMGSSYPLNHSSSNGVDLKDEVAQEERAIEQTLTKLKRSLSFRSFNIAANDFQAVRNDAKVQVLQTHNKHRIGAFEVQVTLCINPNAHHHHHMHARSPHGTPQRPQSAPSSSLKSSQPQSSSYAGNGGFSEPIHDQPRQLIQHVLYSKLYHGAWPSIMKLRERLEVLLDTHGVTRLVAGSTVRSSFFASGSVAKRPDSAPSPNPVLTGPLSAMEQHHRENLRKIEEQQRRMRRRHSSSSPVALEQMNLAAELQREAEEDAAAASQWQEKELKKIKPLEELLPPVFDNRQSVAAVSRHGSMAESGSSVSPLKQALAPSHAPPPNKKVPPPPSLHPGVNSPIISPSLQTKQPFQRTFSGATVENNQHQAHDNTAAPAEPTSQANTSQRKAPPPALETGADSKDVSLSEADVNDMDDEILRTMRAAESQKHAHDWSDEPVKGTDTPDKVSKRSALSATSSSFSSPEGIVKLGKTKSVSFYGDVDKVAANVDEPSIKPEATVAAKVELAAASTALTAPSLKKADEEISPIKKPPSAPRPTMIKKPSLRSQPSMKDLDSDAGDDADSAEQDPDATPATGGSAMGSAKSSSLSEHFKQNDTNTLREALLSIQRMLSNEEDDSDENLHYDRFDDEEHPHLMRSDTFADDPFFQKLENESVSVMRISVNLGQDLSDDMLQGSPMNPDDATNELRGGVQVAVTEVPRGQN